MVETLILTRVFSCFSTDLEDGNRAFVCVCVEFQNLIILLEKVQPKCEFLRLTLGGNTICSSLSGRPTANSIPLLQPAAKRVATTYFMETALSMPLDESLLARLKARTTGETALSKEDREYQAEAFEAIVGLFEGPLFRYFYCEHRNYHRAEEQVSDTFLELVRTIHRMQGSAEQFASFVFGIAKNVRMRHWRGQISEPTRDANVLDVSLVEDTELDFVGSLEHRDQIDHILSIIGGFPPNTRDVILLRFVEGYSTTQISEVLDMPVGSVKSYIHRGIAQLQIILAPKDQGT